MKLRGRKFLPIQALPGTGRGGRGIEPTQAAEYVPQRSPALTCIKRFVAADLNEGDPMAKHPVAASGFCGEMEASTGIEPVYTDLQSAASPLRQLAFSSGALGRYAMFENIARRV